MTAFHSTWAWLGGDRLVADVTIVERDGVIVDVAAGIEPPHRAVRFDGVILPGLVNAHSHAFHRALRHRTHDDGGDFWRWREEMLAVAGRLDPDTMSELATAVFAGMVLTGITTVAEFHYVHHDVDGTPYGDPNAMGHASDPCRPPGGDPPRPARHLLPEGWVRHTVGGRPPPFRRRRRGALGGAR